MQPIQAAAPRPGQGRSSEALPEARADDRQGFAGRCEAAPLPHSGKQTLLDRRVLRNCSGRIHILPLKAFGSTISAIRLSPG